MNLISPQVEKPLRTFWVWLNECETVYLGKMLSKTGQKSMRKGIKISRVLRFTRILSATAALAE